VTSPRPPLRDLLAYRLLARRPDHRFDRWLRADLDSRWFVLRDVAPSVALVALLAVGLAAFLGTWSWPDVAVGFGIGTASAVLGSWRGRARRRVRFFPEDVPPDLGPWLPYRPSGNDLRRR
jgi:hypothetical protein